LRDEVLDLLISIMPLHGALLVPSIAHLEERLAREREAAPAS
jgi:hypothetical protein